MITTKCDRCDKEIKRGDIYYKLLRYKKGELNKKGITKDLCEKCGDNDDS